MLARLVNGHLEFDGTPEEMITLSHLLDNGSQRRSKALPFIATDNNGLIPPKRRPGRPRKHPLPDAPASA